jgi:hypothetical protein
MGKYTEVFVAFDVAKKKHAVAIAEGGRTGKSGLWAMLKTILRRSSGRSKDWRTDTTGCISALKPGLRDTDSVARCRCLGMTAWWSLRR